MASLALGKTSIGDADFARHVVVGDDLRELVRQEVANVAVVTTALDDGPPAVASTRSFTSVSLRPPLVSFCLDRGVPAWPAFERAEHVGIHLLGADQVELARAVTDHDDERLDPSFTWRRGPYGVPLVDALAWLVCRVAGHTTAGDHTVLIAEPFATGYSDGAPLVSHDGRYLCLP